jgi:U4/U6 small nuclear ribonucleoprotein PRP31
VTELRKAQNRMVFGQPEEEIGFAGEETIGLGMLGGSTGKVRVHQADTRVKATVSKKYQNKTYGSSGQSSGLSSSVAFTPVKGIELENPDLQKKRVQEANDRYFGTTFKKPKKQQ